MASTPPVSSERWFESLGVCGRRLVERLQERVLDHLHEVRHNEHAKFNAPFAAAIRYQVFVSPVVGRQPARFGDFELKILKWPDDSTEAVRGRAFETPRDELRALLDALWLVYRDAAVGDFADLERARLLKLVQKVDAEMQAALEKIDGLEDAMNEKQPAGRRTSLGPLRSAASMIEFVAAQLAIRRETLEERHDILRKAAVPTRLISEYLVECGYKESEAGVVKLDRMKSDVQLETGIKYPPSDVARTVEGRLARRAKSLRKK